MFGVMVAARGDRTEPVPLEQVAGKRNRAAGPFVGGNRAQGRNVFRGLNEGPDAPTVAT